MSEVEDLRRQIAAAREDIDGFVEEIRDLNDENARLRQELECRREVRQ